MIRSPLTGVLEVATWQEALNTAAEALANCPPSQLAFVAGQLADAESLVALKDLAAKLGSDLLLADVGPTGDVDADVRPSYLLNTGLSNLEDADVVLLVGCDPRTEAPLVNSRLRKASPRATVASIGPGGMDLTFPVAHLGESPDVLRQLAEGRHPFACQLATAERPVIIVGAGAFRRPDRDAIIAALHTISELVSLAVLYFLCTVSYGASTERQCS